MKIVQRTSTRLTLQERLLGIWLLGAFVAVIGLLVVVAFNSPFYLFGGFCIAISNLIVFLSPIETCTFDKSLKKVTMKRQRWLKSSVTNHAIEHVLSVQVEKSLLLRTQFYRVSLMLVSGQRLPLTQFPSTDWRMQQEVATHIRRFLSSN